MASLGVTVWAMVDVEADDALGAAAKVGAEDERVDRVVICTPDKDLAQCVGGKVVQFDRRAGQFRDSEAVLEKYGVLPESIPGGLDLELSNALVSSYQVSKADDGDTETWTLEVESIEFVTRQPEEPHAERQEQGR